MQRSQQMRVTVQVWFVAVGFVAAVEKILASRLIERTDQMSLSGWTGAVVWD